MTIQDKIQRTDKTITFQNIEASSSFTLLSVLPFVLAANNETLLTLDENKNLRLTCRAAKAAVDPYFSSFIIDSAHLLDTVRFEAFRRSSVFLAAKELHCEDVLTRGDLTQITRTPFKNLQQVSFKLDSTEIDLFPLCKWNRLKNLKLVIWWFSDEHPLNDLNSAWESLSKAEWPLLESLAVNIYIQIPNEGAEPGTVDAYSIYEYDEPLADTNVIKGIVCLLSYFPKLRNLKIEPRMRLEDVKAFIAAPHSNLESVKLSVKTLIAKRSLF